MNVIGQLISAISGRLESAAEHSDQPAAGDSRLSRSQAAAAVGCSPVTIGRLARNHEIGERTANGRLFTTADVERLRELFQGRPGRPRSRGNLTSFQDVEKKNTRYS